MFTIVPGFEEKMLKLVAVARRSPEAAVWDTVGAYANSIEFNLELMRASSERSITTAKDGMFWVRQLTHAINGLERAILNARKYKLNK